MTRFNVSKFMYETIAGGYESQLPISSVCNAHCIFCSNMMNPFPILREGFRSIDDIKRGLVHISGKHEIRLSDSLPGRISEGEALLHPDLFRILGLIREKFPQTVIQITTNGSLLTKEMIEKFIPYKPMHFTISYHSDNQELWCKIYKLGEDKYKIARNSFFYLLKNNFFISAAMVPLPSLVGYEDLENTLRYLKIFTSNLTAWIPGYSYKAGPAIRKLLAVDPVELSNFMITMRKKYRLDIDLTTDPLKPLNFNPREILTETNQAKYKNILWLFSEAAYTRNSRTLRELNPFQANNHYSFPVKNHTYRGNIICAGLLMVNDFRKALKDALKKTASDGISIDLVLLPDAPFDRYGDDLQGDNFACLIDEFKLPVWVR